MVEDKSLVGGFVITVGNQEYDWSTKERLSQLGQLLLKTSGSRKIGTEGIVSILKSEIDNFDQETKNKEIGYVTWIGDGIANVDGIDHAMYGEIVMFDNGLKGLVQDVRANDIGCILFGNEDDIKQGARVVRTGKCAGVPVGEEFLGRVVDALGAPIDGEGDIKASDYYPIENEAPGIVDRKSVGVPMETGILSIDSMFPIGRGQRELIIGDRQTGKTSIAIDTILNQKGKDVVCVYVAIGQKASTVAKIVNTLKNGDAMDYTIIVASTASDPASLQYIAPYSGTALAEYFMLKGKDVLIIYDDLSKHAVAYRALSLLLERSPGREAYPGDVFYLHSRLLERSSRLSDELGGGSITALPIVETQAGDVSAYIPTNVISITDGQIFLESDLFFAGMRPAVNVGLSVSRVGGAAQTKAMKKAAGSIRIDLAQYREMEVFTQFSSDLDDVTKEQLAYGSSLMELLKQPLCKPLSLHEQVITLCAASNKLFLDVDKKKIKEFQKDMLLYFEEEHMDIIKEIESNRELPAELSARIVEAAKEFKSRS
ncbi:MAG: F0F1 ATP synthase subunit alpha [Clostridiales bacterium]|nr:F0F1 ATP synthase subunit alpha [Clostridiales bacterium]